MDEPAVACRDVLSLCDGYNCAFGKDYQFYCMLEAGHSGPHYDELEHDGRTVAIAWHTKPFTVSIAESEVNSGV